MASPQFTFQLHRIEYVPAKPSPLYEDGMCIFAKDAKVFQVPTLHLYGRTSDGSSVCAKIRNLYPYFYIEVPQPYPEDMAAWIVEVGAGIDFTINGRNDPTRSLVHRIDLVKARIMYHYDANPRAFCKISMYNPYHTKKATEAFQTGRIGGCQIRCYESHIPFTLQFMIDYNLFGMDSVELEDVNVIPNDADDRDTSCDLEVECSASQIRNIDKLSRFGSLRNEAKGQFPSFHVMPSVVAMLESLGLDTNSSGTQARTENITSMDCFGKHKELAERLFRADRFLPLPHLVDQLPKAYSYSAERPALLSSCWDRFSFGFSSQQIQRASMHFKSEPASQAPIPEENLTSEDFNEVEDILGAMLQDSSQPDNTGVPQYDGNGDDFTVMDMWSDNSYETESIIARAEFSDEGPAKPSYTHVAIPPSTASLLESLRRHKLPRKVHQQPFDGVPKPSVLPGSRSVTIEPAAEPPISYKDAFEWLKAERELDLKKSDPKRVAPRTITMSQIDGPTQKCSMGFDPAAPQASQLSSHDNLSILSFECFGDGRGELLSDPQHDPLLMVCWSFLASTAGQEIATNGVIMVDFGVPLRMPNSRVVSNEQELFSVLVQLVDDLDPDILCGYEIENLSWGHLHERSLKLGLNFARSISRIHAKRRIDPAKPDSEDPFAAKRTSTFQVTGRICLNLWRVMRSELTLRVYSFENVAMQVLHSNVPKYRHPLLRKMFHGGDERLARPDIVAKYLSIRAQGNIDLLIKTEVLNRTCEFARLYGVEFFSVISRGSQYKVESLMIRLAHLENFLAFSPSRQDLVRMAAPEALPLVMEPKSAFYVDPIVVLDFQALYPSIIIAYNYCFTTCLGRISEAAFPRTLGANFLQEVPPKAGPTDGITVSPNRIAFVSRDVREGVLPKMLTELLEARITVKAELARESDPMRRKILDARQLGLKLISNVTYGYTSASFSGRMPSIEIADSIVQTGRATLEQAVKWIHEHPDWDAYVVYGDTDSLFIKLAGRTMEEAHRLGREMAAYVSAKCPPPVKLKFEKVYCPSFLMSKKRYVGFKYEKPSDQEPIFDAKGIETVRRDTCPLVSKILEKSLKIMARTKDISQVRSYVQRQFQKILAGAKHNLADFVFCKEVRLGTYAADRKQLPEEGPEDDEDFDVEGGQRPHSAIIALQRIQQDPRDTPQYGERVPYVIVYGQGNDKLRELVASPDDLVRNPNLRINAVYYIVKCLIPALNRPLGLIPGLDVSEWYASLPRPTSRPLNAAAFVRLGKTKQTGPSIDSFFKSSSCLICGGRDAHELVRNGGSARLCRACSSNNMRPQILADLLYRRRSMELELNSFYQFSCHHNNFADGPVTDLTQVDVSKLEMCWSFECPLFWKAISLRQNEVLHLATIDSALQALTL